MSTGQIIYALALLATGASFILASLTRASWARLRRWAYSPRRTVGTTRVSRDEMLDRAMRRHPAGSRR